MHTDESSNKTGEKESVGKQEETPRDINSDNTVVHKIHGELQFVGVNREDSNKYRPKHILEVKRPGGVISKTHNDGFYIDSCDEPYLIVHNTLTSEKLSFPISEVLKAMNAAYYRYVITDLVPEMGVSDISNLSSYIKSIKTGHHRTQVKMGKGKICTDCDNFDGSKCKLVTSNYPVYAIIESDDSDWVKEQKRLFRDIFIDVRTFIQRSSKESISIRAIERFNDGMEYCVTHRS